MKPKKKKKKKPENHGRQTPLAKCLKGGQIMEAILVLQTSNSE
jgi:hypothetical protein